MTDIEAEIANTLKEIEELKEETRAIVAKAKELNDADDIHKKCKHGTMPLDYCQKCDDDIEGELKLMASTCCKDHDLIPSIVRNNKTVRIKGINQ